MSDSMQVALESHPVIDEQTLAAMPMAWFKVDDKGKVEIWSSAMEDATGVPTDEIVGKKFWMAFYKKRQKTPVDAALRFEEQVDEEFEFTHRETGDPVNTRIRVNPLLNEDGEAIAAVGLFGGDGGGETDPVAARALTNLNNLPTPVMEIDKDFNVVFMNGQGARLLGIAPKELIGRKCYDLFRTTHCNTPNCACVQAMQRGQSITEETVADPTGLNMPIRYTGAPVRDESGNVVGALEFILDVTEEKKAAAEVQKSIDTLNAIPTVVMSIDTDFNVQYLNPAGTQLVGSSLDQVRGRKCYDLFKTPHCRTEKCACTQAMRAGMTITEETVADPNGLNMPIEYTGAPLHGPDGKVVGALEYVIDITDRKNVLNDIVNVAKEMAGRNLTAKATGDYQGDFLAIAENLNRAVDAQNDAMVQVAEAVDQLSSASGQIAASSQSVAEGASEQASSLEETSSSLEEMEGMTRQNADNTQQAMVLSQTTQGVAEKGSEAMSRMMTSMSQIRDAAESTAQIIRDINDIAFQTNLLALNAAVEAARAGEAGRGFAVVAEEVRNLAQRSKEAAQKTEQLIKQSVKLAEGGQDISREVSSNLDEIVSSVSKVTSIVTEIAAASQEQSRGIEQVNRAVTEMDKVTQQAAANAEESSSAAEELSGQAEELAAMVGRFQLDRGDAHSAVIAAPVERAPARRRAPARSRAKKTSIRVAPEELIPLDDDPDFADF